MNENDVLIAKNKIKCRKTGGNDLLWSLGRNEVVKWLVSR